MTITARFAPSPTGFLHIGGARTALFNWLFARHHGGRFLLRIEDTDKARSTKAAIDAIIDGLDWLGLKWDGEIVMQSERAQRHAEVVHQMLSQGRAYRCYCSPEELAAMRERQKSLGQPMRYDGTWRDRDASEAPAGVPPVIRLKAPQTGDTIIQDGVQGEVKVANAQLDDLVLLRADGSPTYMLSVVVDDHDMDVTHVIRGDDHLTNAFRQTQIYRAMGWDVPSFSHIPLIHGPDGAKLSKRHGALGIEAYRDMGYLPEALRNYLLRLGWAHGDAETISTEEAIQWFDLDGVGRSPARFDFAKLDNLNGHYLRQADNDRLTELVASRLAPDGLDASKRDILRRGMDGLKARAKTLVELAQNAGFYVASRPLALDAKAASLATSEARGIAAELIPLIEAAADWQVEALEAVARDFTTAKGIKLGAVAQPLRIALTGSTISPGIFDVMAVLGRDETLGRLRDFAAQSA
ncbi:MAG TPA: glutamate--tRNA ligase [Stellaceae bacterium]|nr:glutamate--tRNA ligase [Stellaceae bacterium]